MGKVVQKIVELAGAQQEADAKRHEMLSLEGEGNDQVLTLRSRTIRTLEDALTEGNVDQTIWEVEKWVLNKWDMAAKLKHTYSEDQKYKERLAATELWQVKVWLRRKAPKVITDAIELIHTRAEKYSPRYKLPPVPKTCGDMLAIVGLWDHHFGKLCWKEETGNNYDLKIAEAVWENAAEDMLGYFVGLPIKKFQVTAGQDLVHFDNLQGMTAKGTPQDCDGRYPKVIDTAFWSLVRLVERLMQYAEVDITYVPDNHGPLACYHIARELKRHFRKVKRVTVDIEFRKRKYIEWGTALLGISHAENVKQKWDKLPNLMRQEAGEAFARTTHHEWLIGHDHNAKKKETLPMADVDGVRVRTLPSLSGTDAWHYDHGYTSKRATESYLYSASRGYVGHFSVNAREA